MNPFSKKIDIKEMVENKIKSEWPNARVKVEADTNEQEIRRGHQDLYEKEKQQMEEKLAKESIRQIQLTYLCDEENLLQCLDEAKRARQTAVNRQIDPLPEVEINENKKSKPSVNLRFKQIRLNYVLSYLVFVAAAVNNLHIFLTSSSSFNGTDDSLMIMTLTLIVMGGIFHVGKFAHSFIYGQRLERAMVSLLGVAIGLILFLFYLSLANLLLDGTVLSIAESILKTVHTLPTLVLLSNWFITGIVLGQCGFILGLWNDNVELLGLRARNKVIKKRIAKLNKLQNSHIKNPDRWFDQRNQHLVKFQKSIINKERTVEAIKTTIDELKSNYTSTVTDYRSLLANWTGTDLCNDVITSLFEIENSFNTIEDAITKDRENLLVLQTTTNGLREKSNKTKQAIFDCFEEEIKHLKEQAYCCNANSQVHDIVEEQSVNRIANLKEARKIA